MLAEYLVVCLVESTVLTTVVQTVVQTVVLMADKRVHSKVALMAGCWVASTAESTAPKMAVR